VNLEVQLPDGLVDKFVDTTDGLHLLAEHSLLVGEDESLTINKETFEGPDPYDWLDRFAEALDMEIPGPMSLGTKVVAFYPPRQWAGVTVESN
jgi:hypothetical protein